MCVVWNVVLVAVDDLNRKTGSNVDPLADPNELMKANTRNLMSAVSSLPGGLGG